jgi:hypothetical protein
VLSSVAVSVLALAVLVWVAGQPGRALRSPASSTERGDAAIGSGYTLHAVTADRPRLVATAKRGDGRSVSTTPTATIVPAPGSGSTWVALGGSAPTAAPLHFGLSRRAPPSPPSS